MNNFKKDIFFSVIICCFNSSEYLNETIESVINQQFKNWELILINDGSTDNTEEIIKFYLKKNNKIKYYYQKNKGYPNARNKGVELAIGKWISLIDHDDIMMPNKLEEQYQDIMNNPKHFLFFSNTMHIDSKGKYLNKSCFIYNPLKNDYNLINIGLDLIQNGCFIGTETAIFKKDIIKKIGGFNERYTFISDYDFFIRVGLTYKIFFNNKVLSKHRIHDKNMQHYYFKSGIGYWEYVKLYLNYMFNIKITIFNKRIVLKRMFLYIFYAVARSIINVRFIGLIYHFIRKKITK